MEHLAVISSDFDNKRREELLLLLFSAGDDVKFDDIIWRCNKLYVGPASEARQYSLYFKNVPIQYIEIVKYFVLQVMQEGLRLKTISSHLSGIIKFCNFLQQKYEGLRLLNVTKNVCRSFENYLISQNLAALSRSSAWTATSVFFKALKGWPEMPAKNPVYRNPFTKRFDELNINEKYIPEYVTQQLDKVFKDPSVPLYLRVIYWVVRSIPSRISEVLGMKCDCLKPFGAQWVIFIPTWKQNGNYFEPQIRAIHLKNEGHGAYLMELIKEQQSIALALQNGEEEEKYLFVHPRYSFCHAYYNKTGLIKYNVSGKYKYFAKYSAIYRMLQRICYLFEVTNEKGQIYQIKSHEFRHNGITDRLYQGFQPTEIRYMTGHQNETMIMTSYKHTQPKLLMEKQRLVHAKSKKKESSPIIFFKGRILNMNPEQEERLLRNPRAHRLSKLGICSDISGCISGIFECFDCDYFIPDIDSLEYFEEQVKEWAKKVEQFKNHVFMRENAQHNLNLTQKLVNKIRIGLEVIDEKSRYS